MWHLLPVVHTARSSCSPCSLTCVLFHLRSRADRAYAKTNRIVQTPKRSLIAVMPATNGSVECNSAPLSSICILLLMYYDTAICYAAIR